MTSDEQKAHSNTRTHLDDDETQRHGDDRPHHHAAHLRGRSAARYSSARFWSKGVVRRTQTAT